MPSKAREAVNIFLRAILKAFTQTMVKLAMLFIGDNNHAIHLTVPRGITTISAISLWLNCYRQAFQPGTKRDGLFQGMDLQPRLQKYLLGQIIRKGYIIATTSHQVSDR